MDEACSPGRGTMLYRYCRKFLEYCQLAHFSNRSIQTPEIRFGELRSFARTRKLKSIITIKYLHLAEFNNPPIHVRKSREWTLRQFYHFLSLHGYALNIAEKLPYPKIDKTVPHFLTQDEHNRLICHFSSRATDLRGHGNLVIILLLGTLGLRTTTLSLIRTTDLSESSFVKHLNKAAENR
jgi:integrase/recombinase XerC